MSTTPPGGPADRPHGTPDPDGYPPPGSQPHGQQPYGGQQYGQDYGQAPYGQQPYGGQQYGQAPYASQPSGDDRTIAVLAHLSPLIALVLSAGWLSVLGPLIVWFVWRDRGPLIRQAAAGAFNFNLTVWAAFIIGWICLFTVILIPLTIVLWIGAFIAQVVLSIRGAMAANRGELFRYPMQIKVLS